MNGGKTGWPPGLLQDDSRPLARWFASRLDARIVVRKVCAEIEAERKQNMMRKLLTYLQVLWEYRRSTVRGAFTAAYYVAFKGTPF